MHSRTRRLLGALATFTTTGVLACGDGTGPADVALGGITLIRTVDTLGIADTVHLEARALGADYVVVDVPVTWRSLTPALATVTEAGLLTGIDSGDVQLVASARGRNTVTDTILVRVRPMPRAFELSGLGDTLYVSSQVTVRPTVMDGRGLVIPTPRLQWSSSDTSVLVVDSLGRATGRGLGSAWLRVAAGTASDSVRVAVDYRQITTPVPFVRYAPPGFVGGTGCGLTAAGAVWCNGAALATSVAFTDVQVGQSVVCGLAADSTSYCWGSNAHGQFGNSTRTPTTSNVPLLSHGGRKLRRLAVGDHLQTCAIQAADSVVYCVGHNDFGQVGRLPVSSDDTLFSPITGALKALDLDITGFHGCAIAHDGALWCWGDPGTLGLSYASGQGAAPVRLTPPGAYVQVATVQWLGACMRASDGTVDCLIEGQLRRVQTTARFATIAAGTDNMICGLTATGEMWCWVILSGSSGPTITPRRIAPGRTYVALSAGRACMLDAQQRLYCF